MFTTDSHVNIHKTQLKSYDWGQYDNKLNYKWRKEKPVTTYKLSKQEMEEYKRRVLHCNTTVVRYNIRSHIFNPHKIKTLYNN